MSFLTLPTFRDARLALLISALLVSGLTKAAGGPPSRADRRPAITPISETLPNVIR